MTRPRGLGCIDIKPCPLPQVITIRRIGNMVLSFLTKAAVGYWHCFDPCNGYVAVRGDVLRQIPPAALGTSFFFETSMLAQLYLEGVVIQDVPMAARYGDSFAKQTQAVEYGEAIEINGVTVWLSPAGHILGSAVLLLRYG